MVLMCDFSDGFKVPEITKVRPVVVVSPHHMHHSELYTVVPFSTTRPHIIRQCHYYFEKNPLPNKEKPVWAKCDLVCTVARHRLDRIKLAKRKYVSCYIQDQELQAIRQCLRYVLGIA